MNGVVRRVVHDVERAREFAALVSDPLRALEDARDRRGDVAQIPVPGTRLFQFTHPTDVERVLKLKHRDRLATESLRDLLGDGLISTNREGAQGRRRLLGKPLDRKAVADYITTMQAETAAWVDGILAEHEHEARTRELTSGLFSLSLRILLRTLFGARVSVDLVEFGRELDAYMFEFYLDNSGWRRVLPQRVPTVGRRRRAAAVSAMRDMGREAIRRRRAMPPEEDLLSRMLEADAEHGQFRDEEDLLDEVLTMLIPGHETPALMLGYALLLLAEHPDAQARLHREVVASGKETLGVAFLGAVVDESFRMYPPAYVVGREVRSDVTIGGFALEPGDQLIAPQWVVHRDPRWWVQPARFHPERWLNGETEDLLPGTFFPFGGGRRSCLGGHFSRMMGQVVLAEIVRRMKVAPDPSYRMEFIQGPTLRPKNGIRLHVSSRRRSDAASPTADLGDPNVRSR